MQIYYFLYLCPEQTIILAMEIEIKSMIFFYTLRAESNKMK